MNTIKSFLEYKLIKEGYNLNTLKASIDAGLPLKVEVDEIGICEVVDIDVRDIHDGTLTVKDSSGVEYDIEHDQIVSTVMK
jgi:hypothetical protein